MPEINERLLSALKSAVTAWQNNEWPSADDYGWIDEAKEAIAEAESANA